MFLQLKKESEASSLVFILLLCHLKRMVYMLINCLCPGISELSVPQKT